MGTVEEGKRADPRCCCGPPQEVVKLSTISSVFLRGRHLDSPIPQKMKADVAAAHEAAALLHSSSAIDPDHVH